MKEDISMRQVALGLFLLCCFPCFVRPQSVNMQVTRYCSKRRWGRCSEWKRPYGNFWKNAGVKDNVQDKIAFGFLSQPSRSNVEYIAIFSSGQQTSSGSGSVVSGAGKRWKWNTYQRGSKSLPNDYRSAAQKFRGKLPRHKTLHMTMYNSQFDQFESSADKQEMLDAMVEYLNSKVYWSKIKGIVLVGSSRGGCFMYRLAGELYKKKTKHHHHTNYVLASVDGVCYAAQGELGTSNPASIKNPLTVGVLTKNFKAHPTNILAQFPSPGIRDHLCALHIAGGDAVAFSASGVRTWSHTAPACRTAAGCTIGNFYRQVWTDKKHTEIGRDYAFSNESVGAILNHFDSCADRFGWSNAQSPAPAPTPLPPHPIFTPRKPSGLGFPFFL